MGEESKLFPKLALDSPCQPGNSYVTSVGQQRVELEIPCVVNLESKSCETHDIGLTEFKHRVKTWSKCSNGLYRNVFKIQKTFKCSASAKVVQKNLSEPSIGGKQNPKPVPAVQVYSTSVKRKKP